MDAANVARAEELDRVREKGLAAGGKTATGAKRVVTLDVLHSFTPTKQSFTLLV
jgi:hypothetical protein